jgi:hypothetical protein
VVNHHKPRVQTLVVSRYPTPAPVHDFVLLFLPPCSPHLTPLATRSLKPSVLVYPLLGGPASRRPFALALHLHQRKSSCNLHLQYSAKSQSTPCCQSLITSRSDHPSVLGRSSPQWATFDAMCFLCSIGSIMKSLNSYLSLSNAHVFTTHVFSLINCVCMPHRPPQASYVLHYLGSHVVIPNNHHLKIDPSHLSWHISKYSTSYSDISMQL